MQKLRNLNLSAVCGVALVAMLGFNSCSTEVDLIAPYESSPVVFGLLDAEVDTQWVRINRTWLGEGDQTVLHRGLPTVHTILSTAGDRAEEARPRGNAAGT